MSFSPPVRFLSSPSSGSLSKQEELINAYEAEEERIINVLSRKLEQLREEKIDLENALEAESESHVNRLNRELTALRLAQQQQQGNGSAAAITPEAKQALDPAAPSAETMLDAMRRENDQLRSRLVDTERDYIRITRLNEIYREELLDHRRRLGLPVDNLIGLASPDPYLQPTHRRSHSSSSASSPTTSVLALPTHPSRPTHAGVPIPRQHSQIHRPKNFSERNTPPSHSPSSSESPFPFSPVASANPTSLLSNNTNMTTPPSSASFNSNTVYGTPARGLSYPSVPPPSLSSSFGSPTIAYHMPHRDPSMSPVESSSRRSSMARRGNYEHRVTEGGHIRRGSVERGARVAETGTLVPRSRASSQSLAPTTEATAAAEAEEANDNEAAVRPPSSS